MILIISYNNRRWRTLRVPWFAHQGRTSRVGSAISGVDSLSRTRAFLSMLRSGVRLRRGVIQVPLWTEHVDSWLSSVLTVGAPVIEGGIGEKLSSPRPTITVSGRTRGSHLGKRCILSARGTLKEVVVPVKRDWLEDFRVANPISPTRKVVVNPDPTFGEVDFTESLTTGDFRRGLVSVLTAQDQIKDSNKVFKQSLRKQTVQKKFLW